MIVLDTHLWVWWVSEPDQLTEAQRREIEAAEQGTRGVSAISCWEVAKLAERGRLMLDRPVVEWLREALAYPAVRLFDLTPEVAAASMQLPGTFHRDPADQIIVETARLYGGRLVTSDRKILAYGHVETVS